MGRSTAMDMLRDMALFVEVAKARSFKRASEALGVPSSTLSRRIADLERAIGARLLNRTTRAVELTEAGTIYFARCGEIVAAARVAHEQLGDLVEHPRGRLRVSTTPEFARLFLAPSIADYAVRYPYVDLEFDLQPHKVDLVAQNFDLALRIGEQPDSSLISRRLGIIRVTLFAAPSYLARAGRPSHPADLSGHRFISNLNSPNPALLSLTDRQTTVEVAVRTPIATNNFGLMRQLAVLGAGMTTLHEPMVGPDVAAGRLEQVLPGWVLKEAPVFALTPSRLLPAKTRLFLAMLSERVAPDMNATFPDHDRASM